MQNAQRRQLLVSKGWVRGSCSSSCAAFIVVGAVRNHGSAADAAALTGLLALAVWIARKLWIDFRTHPDGFPEPTTSQGLRMAAPRDR